MDFSRSKLILKKINALHDSAEAFDSPMSKMEKDLLLHYLREMYEMIATESGPSPKQMRMIETEEQIEQSEVAVNDRADERTVSREILEPIKESEPVVEQVQKPMLQSTPQFEKSTSSNGYHKENASLTKEQEKIVLPEKSPLEDLFNQSEAQVASSRFSQLPIADVAKSMGINDRILTINELFGGDQAAFNNCTHKLNELTSYQSAKDFLMEGAAAHYGWDNPLKQSKAQVFIQLVKRRYL